MKKPERVYTEKEVRAKVRTVREEYSTRATRAVDSIASVLGTPNGMCVVKRAEAVMAELAAV
jgi:hypothetical protein